MLSYGCMLFVGELLLVGPDLVDPTHGIPGIPDAVASVSCGLGQHSALLVGRGYAVLCQH